MKTICTITILSALLYNCSPNHYLLTDNGKDKYYLAEYIKAAAKRGELSSKRPIVVVNGLPFTYDMLKEKKLYFSKSGIKKIEKLSEEDTRRLNGFGGKNDALSVTTFAHISISRYGHALILMNDKPISTDQLDRLDANAIESISVFKGAERVKEFTPENYDSVIVLRMK